LATGSVLPLGRMTASLLIVVSPGISEERAYHTASEEGSCLDAVLSEKRRIIRTPDETN
jgi:hypothetical protein